MLSRNEVKYIQSLYHKKNRDAEGLFVAEGEKTINELLQSDFSIEKIYALKTWINNYTTATKSIVEINEADLKKISNFETPQQVFAIIKQKQINEIPALENKITLVLDGIQDPGNFGTIIRTADWFGVENIIASNDTADVYNPKVVQATMGSITRVNIFYTDLKSFFSNNKIFVCGAMLNGENISALKKINECILVIGNESKGIRDDVIPFIQQKITIPKTGNAESLNAAVAAGIALYSLKFNV